MVKGNQKFYYASSGSSYIVIVTVYRIFADIAIMFKVGDPKSGNYMDSRDVSPSSSIDELELLWVKLLCRFMICRIVTTSLVMLPS